MEKKKKSRTKDKIMDAALDEFIAVGIRESSIDAIALRAEVARRTVYNHFCDRDSILRSIIDSRLEPAIEEIRVLSASSCSLESAAEFCLLFWSRDERLPKLMRKLQEERVKFFSELHDAFLKEFSSYLKNIAESGSLRFSEPLINLKLIFFSLFPVLEIISGRPGFETDFLTVFKKMLAKE